MRDEALAPYVTSKKAQTTQDMPRQLARLDVQLNACIRPPMVDISVRQEVAVVEDCPMVEEARRRHMRGAAGTNGHGSQVAALREGSDEASRNL